MLGFARHYMGLTKHKTMTNWSIREITVAEACDVHAQQIAAITAAAFERQYGSGDGEVLLIAALRADGDVVVELAALEIGDVVGHIMFSRMRSAPERAVAALAPMCARIDRQRVGIGTALVRAGLEACRARGVQAVVVLGDPHYYARFGFSARLAEPLACPYAGPHLHALELEPGALSGVREIVYAKAFAAAAGKSDSN